MPGPDEIAYLLDTQGLDPASAGIAARLRAIQAGVEVGMDINAALVTALLTADARAFCKALGLWYPEASSAVAVSHSGSTGEVVLATIPIPGGSLGLNGFIECKAIFSCTNNANSKTVSARLGTTPVGGTLSQQAVTTTPATNLNFIAGNRSSNLLKVSGSLAAVNAQTIRTPSLDSTGDLNLYLTGQLTNGADTIALEEYVVNTLYRA